MSPSNYQLPEYVMVAGETQNITIMLFTQTKLQIDADGVAARLAVSDYINRNSDPFIVKECSIIRPVGADVASLYCQLSPADTISLRGKYVYQITVKDIDSTVAVLKGIMNIEANVDRKAILQI